MSMKKIVSLLLMGSLLSVCTSAMAQVKLSITLKNALSADVTLSAYQGAGLTPKDLDLKSTSDAKVEFLVAAENLPGEFQISFLYKKTATDNPTGARLNLILNKSDLSYTIDPASIYFDSLIHSPDVENETMQAFINEVSKRKADLPVLADFLQKYGAKDSKFYASASREYDILVADVNRWIDAETRKHQALFASHLFCLEKIPTIDWSQPGDKIFEQQILRFFDHVNLDDSLILKSQNLFTQMNKFIDLFVPRITSPEMADSLLSLAGSIACDKASKGHPKVYGWMVDYFYIGFESLGMEKGMKMLETHINNPNCLTQKKIQIQRRLEGMQRLTPGTRAPGFNLPAADGGPFNLYQVAAPTPNILLFFWSGACEHCMTMATELKVFMEYSENASQISVVAISLDESPAEVAAWEIISQRYPEWVHLRAREGMNSSVAYDYAILSTPVMFLISSADYSILASPNSISELDQALKD
jgi:hypothetical protein